MQMRTVMQVLGHITGQCTKVCTSAMERLWSSVNKLRVNITQVSQSVVVHLSQFVLLAQKLKALVASLITQVQLIKCVVTTALTKVWAIGLQLVTTVRQTLQLVITAFKKK